MDLAAVLPAAYLKQHSSSDLAFSQHSYSHQDTDCCTIGSRLGASCNFESYSDLLFAEGSSDPFVEVDHYSYWTVLDNCSFVPFNLAFLLAN